MCVTSGVERTSAVSSGSGGTPSKTRTMSVRPERPSGPDDVQPQDVEKSGRQELVHGVGAAGDRDVAVARGIPGLRESRLDAVGDEVEGGPALHRHGVARMVREHEHRARGTAGPRPTSRASRGSTRRAPGRTCCGP